MFLIKIHSSYRDVVAICDADLVGKVFENEKFQLNVKENFYGGEEVDEKTLLQRISNMVREDATFNIVGKNSIKIAVENGIISEASVKTIEDIPFSMVLL